MVEKTWSIIHWRCYLVARPPGVNVGPAIITPGRPCDAPGRRYLVMIPADYSSQREAYDYTDYRISCVKKWHTLQKHAVSLYARSMPNQTDTARAKNVF